MAEKVVFEWVTPILRLLPFIFWQVASLAVLIIIVCMLIARSEKRQILSMMVLAVIVGLIIGIEYYERSQIWFIVSLEELNVYMGPAKKYPRLQTLKLKDEVRVIKDQGAWLQIEKKGCRGWIENEKFPIFDKV